MGLQITWSLSESLSRTAEEDEVMLQAAHAAMYFRKIIGNAKHRAHAAQLVAHVYALLGPGNPASQYLAKSCGSGAQGAAGAA